jgi:predicted metal-dependent hydrolase
MRRPIGSGASAWGGHKVIPRNPKINFTAALPHWAPNPTFAQIINAGSTSLPYVEPYLNKVMAAASKQIADATLQRDIALFMAQEGNHYRQHKLFNKQLHARYPGLPALEAKLGNDLETMFRERSLKFNASYCEGFESLGIIHAEFFFEQIPDLLEGADTRVVDLWKWHLAEEFEHRTVCYDVHFALGSGYFARVGGFLYALRHLGAYGKRVSEYLMSVDREAMTPEDSARSRRSAIRYNRRFLRFAWPKLLKILSPFYDPRRKRPPRGAAAFLDGIGAAV